MQHGSTLKTNSWLLSERSVFGTSFNAAIRLRGRFLDLSFARFIHHPDQRFFDLSCGVPRLLADLAKVP